MNSLENSKQPNDYFGITDRALAGFCHKCQICPFADRKPDSTFGKIMRWHRTWCPAWVAHTKIYGRKPLS
ncbi:hypothetical protein ACFLS9_00780 [Bacteroidota bacterium]